jgi:exopolyphosphatase/guanosine-5'-triphosphate,3'-diphosphate pyrophosphatase
LCQQPVSLRPDGIASSVAWGGFIAMIAHTAGSPLAAIDIGTNTIRLLVARATLASGQPGLEELASRTATVRLGYGIERTGRFDPARLALAVETVREYHLVARECGADPILVVATSATRDAANGAELVARIAATTGLQAEIIGGAREAALTFAGATAGLSLTGTVLVADLGGGSLELIVSQDGALVSAASLQIGSGRLTERHIAADPPDEAMVARVTDDAATAIAPEARGAPAIARAILVGGTAKALAVLAPQPGTPFSMTEARIARALAVLCREPAAVLAARTGLDPERVRTLAAGAAIIGAILAAYRLDTATIGTGGIREGILLDYLRHTGVDGGVPSSIT